MPLDGDWNYVYENRSGVNRPSAVYILLKRCIHWGSCKLPIRQDEVNYVDMPFSRCIEEEIYSIHLKIIMQENMDLADAARVLHSLDNVAFIGPFNTIHLFTQFKYRLKKILFHRRFQSRLVVRFFENWHCIYLLRTLSCQCEEFFVQMASWWYQYEGGHLFFAPMPIAFSYHSTSVNRKGGCSLLSSIAVDEHYIDVLMWFFISRSCCLVIQQIFSKVLLLLLSLVCFLLLRRVSSLLFLMSDYSPSYVSVSCTALRCTTRTIAVLTWTGLMRIVSGSSRVCV